MIRVDVHGVPAPKGSKRIGFAGRGTRPIIIDDNSVKKKAWHAVVAAAAQVAMRGKKPYVDVALVVDVTFWIPRPKRHGKNPRGAKWQRWPAAKPDLDKLVRSTMDPLEGIVFDGDSRIVEIRAIKHYASTGQSPGASVTVEEAL